MGNNDKDLSSKKNKQSGIFMKVKSISRKILRKQGILLSFILLCVLLSFLTKRFLTLGNFLNVLIQLSNTTIPALGEALVIITGGIDISVGAVIGLGSVLNTIIYNFGIHPAIALLVALLGGAIVGLINGLLITKIRIPPFIATIGTMTGIKGATALISGYGGSMYGAVILAGRKNSETFQYIGRGTFLGIPISVIIMGLVIIVIWFILNKVKYGTYIFAIGGNYYASRVSGINVENIIIITYVISALCSSLTGAMYASRMLTSQYLVGTGLELPIIAACVIGGISLSGGKGKVPGILLGAATLTVLTNGMNILNIPWHWHLVVQGSVIGTIVFLEKIFKRNYMQRR